MELEDWSNPDYRENFRRAYKRKAWTAIILSAVILPVIGGIIAAVFISLLNVKTRKPQPSPIASSIIAALTLVLLTSLLIALAFENSSSGIRIIAGISIFFLLRSVWNLPKNINKLAERKIQPKLEKAMESLQTQIALIEQADRGQRSSDFFIIIKTEAIRLMLKHIKTIIIKYEQKLYRDDYGELKTSKAIEEVDYFLNDTLPNKLLSLTLPPHLPSQDYIGFLSACLSDPNFIQADIRELITEFMNLPGGEKFEERFEHLLWEISSTQIANLNAIGRSAEYRSSDETLSFLFGDDYQSLCTLASNLLEDGFKVQIPTNFVVSSLIIPEDLLNLKRWLFSRDEHTKSLENVITGEEFEVFCQKRLQELSWNVRTTPKTGDFGADLIVERDGASVIIQCKYYSKPVGVEAVQQVFSAMTFYKATKAAVVSNQSYTKAAQQMAASNNVALLHVNDLDKLSK